MNLSHASRCTECFSIFNVNGTYHIWIAGIDVNAVPNPNVQLFNWVGFERSHDYASDLEAFVSDAYGEVCISGVAAVLNSVNQSLAFPVTWPSSGYVFV
jgi:hypothetical protein